MSRVVFVLLSFPHTTLCCTDPSPSTTPSPSRKPLFLSTILQPSYLNPSCRLQNVIVRNSGIDYAHPSNLFWSHQVARPESCRVILRGRSEFDAQSVTIIGSHVFDVPDGYRMVLRPDTGSRDGFSLRMESLGEEPGWRWQVSVGESGRVELRAHECEGEVGPR